MDSSTNGSDANEFFHAQIHLYKHIYNTANTMALKSAVELGIPDIIHNHGKPITLPELASALQLPPSKTGALQRFLRLLTHNGLFAKTTATVPNSNGEEEEEAAYALTPISKLLLKGKAVDLSPLVRGFLTPMTQDILYSTKKWFSEDKEVTLFESAHGMDMWDYLNQHPEALSGFQGAMAADSQMFKLALKDCKHVFESLGSLVDVAGGTGGVSRLIHEAFPHLKCIVFDQPEVVANLEGSENLSYVGGDMFESIPPADAVLLKWVLHDWSDELSLKILKNCKEAISRKGKEGKLIIIEVVIDEKSDNHELTELKLHSDLMMLALHNGKEREKKEWEKLFFKAGFSNYKMYPVYGFKSLIEVYP